MTKHRLAARLDRITDEADDAEAIIVSNPKIMMGKPVVPGTRITVELILEKLAAGESLDQIPSEHQSLTAEGIRAAIGFAAKLLRAGVPDSMTAPHNPAWPT